MPLPTWVEVKVQSYLARTHVCAGSCMCRVQASALSKLQEASGCIHSVFFLRSLDKRGGGLNSNGHETVHDDM
jgi:hypothetical protein